MSAERQVSAPWHTLLPIHNTTHEEQCSRQRERRQKRWWKQRLEWCLSGGWTRVWVIASQHTVSQDEPARRTHRGTLRSEIRRQKRPRDRIEISGNTNMVAGRSLVWSIWSGEATRVP